MPSLGWNQSRMHGSCKVQTSQKVTTIKQAIRKGGSSKGAKQLLWQHEYRCMMLFEMQMMLKMSEWFNTTASYRCGPWLRFRVSVETEPLLNWQSGSSLQLNCLLGYSRTEIPPPVWIGRVVCGLPSGSICRFILCLWFCCVIMKSYHNHIFDIQHSLFACLVVCNIDYFGISDFLVYCVCLPINLDSSSVMCSTICGMPWLPNKQDQKLLTLHWRSFSWWGNRDVMHCVVWKAAITLYMNHCPNATLRLPKMQDLKLLTLHWCSFSWCGNVDVMCCCASKGRYYSTYESMPHSSTLITQDSRPPLLTIDAHLHDAAASLPLLFLPLRAASISSMDVCNWLQLILPKMHSQKLLTLHCHSFSEWGSDCVTFSVACGGCQYVGYA